MWPHRDFGWWGFWIGVVAFVLAFPLSVMANIVTPKLLNWWSGRSRQSTMKRLEELRGTQARIALLPHLSEAEDRILESAEVTQRLIYFVGYFVILSLASILTVGTRVVSPQHDWQKALVLFLLLTATLVAWTLIYRVLVWPQFVYRRDRSPAAREELKSYILELEAKLSKR
jgi:hypothetical protein